MNAPVSLALDHGLTPAALNGEVILRVLAARPHGQPFASQAAIAEAAGRPPKNIGRELQSLETAGLIRFPGPDHGEWSSSALTDAGWDALTALEKAAGQGEGGLLFIPPAQLDDNPLNPRKVYEATALEAFADTVEADGEIITPLSVSPVQPNGRRYIWAGHRRKRGALLVEARYAARGEDLPAGLARGVPCVERHATPAEALFIAVVENSQRESLTPWEDAQALAALAEATGWSGRELARKTGRAPRLDEGDEEGVRDVQEKIKVARTAPPELIEAHEAGAITWEQLRNALRTGGLPRPAEPAREGDMFPAEAGELRNDTPAGEGEPEPELPIEEPPALQLDARQRLVLLEIAHAARHHPDRMVTGDEADPISWAATGKYWLDMTASSLQTHRLIDFKHHGRPYVRLTPAGLAWMVENIGVELGEALEQARNDVAQAGWPGPDYVTAWLNPPPVTDAQAAPEQTAAEPEDQDARDEAAAALLADVAVFLADTSIGAGTQTDPAAWSDRLTRTGARGPYLVKRENPGVVLSADGSIACVVDVDNTLPDDQVQARAALIAFALNRTSGFQSAETL